VVIHNHDKEDDSPSFLLKYNVLIPMLQRIFLSHHYSCEVWNAQATDINRAVGQIHRHGRALVG